MTTTMTTTPATRRSAAATKTQTKESHHIRRPSSAGTGWKMERRLLTPRPWTERRRQRRRRDDLWHICGRHRKPYVVAVWFGASVSTIDDSREANVFNANLFLGFGKLAEWVWTIAESSLCQCYSESNWVGVFFSVCLCWFIHIVFYRKCAPEFWV